MISKLNFTFSNISPRYLEPLFIQLEYGVWYDSSDMKEVLRRNGIFVEGKEIIGQNILVWSMLKIGDKEISIDGSRKSMFNRNELGRTLQQIYSTNQELFFDLIHFFMYSTWLRTHSPQLGRFWMYSKVCEKLWDSAPCTMDSFGLTGLLQQEATEVFSGFNIKLSERSVRAVYPWLGSLTPPFLIKATSQKNLTSMRREFCSPQLFHLAIDLLYNLKDLKYGTSMAMNESDIEEVCKICLISTERFWEMADRTKMIIRGFEIRKGQFNTSIALESKPNWLELPEYSSVDEYMFEDDIDGDKE